MQHTLSLPIHVASELGIKQAYISIPGIQWLGILFEDPATLKLSNIVHLFVLLKSQFRRSWIILSKHDAATQMAERSYCILIDMVLNI